LQATPVKHVAQPGATPNFYARIAALRR
jgi:hypothetical protein